MLGPLMITMGTPEAPDFDVEEVREENSRVLRELRTQVEIIRESVTGDDAIVSEGALVVDRSEIPE
jgi:hypothetical protein